MLLHTVGSACPATHCRFSVGLTRWAPAIGFQQGAVSRHGRGSCAWLSGFVHSGPCVSGVSRLGEDEGELERTAYCPVCPGSAWADEASGPLGSFLPFPADGEDNTVEEMKGDIRAVRGSMLVVETTTSIGLMLCGRRISNVKVGQAMEACPKCGRQHL